MTECTHCRKRYENGVKFCPVDGYAVVPLAEPMVGRLLMGQFQIQSVCGHGATGTVYRATQVGIDREVAIKLLRADLLKDPDVIKRFVREARAGARLNHPNIATVHMVGQTDEGVPFLAMEFVEGVPLSAVLGVGKPMQLRRLCHIGAQIASALAEAHGQGIVHRDLKPENILLTERRGESDVVKVVDFGIAKMIAHAAPGEDPISRMGTVFGTPHYIAPEQAAGQPVDGRADIYSLGCILFQMATGRVPFDGQQGLQVLLRQVRDPVPDPRTLNPRISDALAELILKMLAKDPSARPQSAALTVEAIRSLDSDGQSQLAPSPAVPRSGAPKRKETSRSGAPAPAPAPVKAEPAKPEQSWYQQEEEESQTSAADRDEDPDDEDDEEEEPIAVAARPTGRRHRAAEQQRPRSGRPDREPRSGARRPPRRPSQDSLDESEDRPGGGFSFWQRSWMPIVGISSAVVLGALAGLLYAHYHAAQPMPPPLTPPPVALAPPAPATALVKSSSSGRSSTPARPAAAPAANPAAAPARQPETSVPVTIFPAAPPLTGPRPLGPGPTVSAPGPSPTVAPAPAVTAPPLAVFAPAPAAPPTVTAPPPAALAPIPAAAAPAPVPAPAVAAPAAAPAPETPKPAPAAKPEEPAAPAKPPEGKTEEPDESSSDPYHRLQ